MLVHFVMEKQYIAKDKPYLLELSESYDPATRRQRMFQHLTSTARALGFDFAAYEIISGYEPSRRALCINNYPECWRIRYREQGYRDIDPAILRAPRCHLPFLWKDLKKDCLSPRQVRFFKEAEAYGLADGVSIPLHGPFGRLVLISFVSNAKCQSGTGVIGVLNVAAIHYELACRSIECSEPNKIHLSRREKECLSWAAAGKSSWDIGRIVGISENTVNFHIRNSMKKLDCSNRRVAIVRAIQMALIRSPDF